MWFIIKELSCARIIHYTSGISVKKSTLLPYANTQSPDKTECNQSLR